LGQLGKGLGTDYRESPGGGFRIHTLMASDISPISFTLNVLDQSPIPQRSTAGDALRNTLDLACLADDLGYGRYWVAEHHGTPGLACASPEVIIGPLAAATSRIRVGSGGIMLPHYSPLKVAENFSMLAGLYPSRIDLGIGRAPGTSARVALALQRDRRLPLPNDFREQLEELLGFFANSSAALRFARPEPWLLGSSAQSAIWAAELGLPYVFADFINPQGAEMARYYREHFTGNGTLEAPRPAVAVWAICAPSDEEALRLSASFRMMMLQLYRGRLIPVPTVEEALSFLEREGLPMGQLPAGRRILTGSPRGVRAALEAVAAEYGASEVFVVNIMYEHAARRRSYELIAEACGLRANRQTNPFSSTYP
jgi:luciferase family oxidoreductase group 1